MRTRVSIMQRVVTGKLDISCKWYDMSIVLTDFSSYTFIMNTCHMSHMPFSYRLHSRLFCSLILVLCFSFTPCSVCIFFYCPLSHIFCCQCLLAFLQFSFQFEFFSSISSILFIHSSSIWILLLIPGFILTIGTSARTRANKRTPNPNSKFAPLLLLLLYVIRIILCCRFNRCFRFSCATHRVLYLLCCLPFAQQYLFYEYLFLFIWFWH